MDAVRNWDYDYYDYHHPLYSGIVSIQVIDDVTTEPVTLAEIKEHLLVDYSYKDAYLTKLGKRARIQIEKETGVALAPKTLRVELRNETGNVRLPYWIEGVSEIVELTDWEGTSQLETSYTLENGILKTYYNQSVFVEYETGYAEGECPEDYKQMILERCAFLDANRGDEKKTYNNRVWL
jgi:hypothetical protein